MREQRLGGVTWKPTAPGVEMSMNVLVIDPRKPNVLYAALAGSIGGLFKSTDSGMSWFPINNGLAELMEYPLASFNPGNRSGR